MPNAYPAVIIVLSLVICCRFGGATSSMCEEQTLSDVTSAHRWSTHSTSSHSHFLTAVFEGEALGTAADPLLSHSCSPKSGPVGQDRLTRGRKVAYVRWQAVLGAHDAASRSLGSSLRFVPSPVDVARGEEASLLKHCPELSLSRYLQLQSSPVTPENVALHNTSLKAFLIAEETQSRYGRGPEEGRPLPAGTAWEDDEEDEASSLGSDGASRNRRNTCVIGTHGVWQKVQTFLHTWMSAVSQFAGDVMNLNVLPWFTACVDNRFTQSLAASLYSASQRRDAWSVLVAPFLIHRVVIRVHSVPINASEHNTLGHRYLLRLARESLGLYTFAPLINHSSTEGPYYCNVDAVRMLSQTYHVAVSQAASSGSAAAPSALLSAIGGTIWSGILKDARAAADASSSVSLVHRHCVPTASGDASTRSFAPDWLRWMLGLEPIVSDLRMDSRMAFTNQGEEEAFLDLECSVQRRWSDDALCFSAAAALPRNQDGDETTRSTLHVASELTVDRLFISLLAVFLVVTVIKPFLLAHPSLQVVLCAVLGVFVMLCLVIFYVVKDIQRTRIGRVGLIGLLSVGGFFVLTEGLISALIALFIAEVQGNVVMQMSLLGTGIVSGILSRMFLMSILPSIVSVLFTTLQIALVAILWNENPDASLVVILGYVIVVPLRAPVVLFRVMRFLIVKVVLRLVLSFKKQRSEAVDEEDNAAAGVTADDALPKEAMQERGYTRPKCAAIEGRTHAERMRHFDQVGTDCTRKALADLAELIRTNPNKYAKRVQDPNGLARFAGVE